jgi:hypothetical protein
MRFTALTRACAQTWKHASGLRAGRGQNHRVNAGGGACRADQLAAPLPAAAWHLYLAGQVAKGHRYYDWAWASTDQGRPGHHWLLIRRHLRTGKLAFYRCCAPGPVPLAALVKVAGIRWTVEEDFQASKGLAGWDQHRVRRWNSWHRWPPWPRSPPRSSPSRGHRAHQPPNRRPDPADPQRNQPPARRPRHPASPRHHPPAALVHLAATPPAPRQNLPLGGASRT